MTLCFHPFHKDFTLFSKLIPLLLPLGVAVGLGSALILSFTTSTGERKRLPGFLLLISCLSWWGGEIVAQQISWPSLLVVPPVALALQQGLRRCGNLALGWMVDGLVRPLVLLVMAMGILCIAVVGHLLPDLPRYGPSGVLPGAEQPDRVILILAGIPGPHLGSLGHDRNTSPILDQLAREGDISPLALSNPSLESTAKQAADLGIRTGFFSLQSSPVLDSIAAAHGWTWDFSQPSLRASLQTTRIAWHSVARVLLANIPIGPEKNLSAGPVTKEKQLPADQALDHILRWLDQDAQRGRVAHAICRLDLSLAIPWNDLSLEEQERFLPDQADSNASFSELAKLDARIRRMDTSIGKWIQALQERERLETTDLIMIGGLDEYGFRLERLAKRIRSRG